MTDGCTLHLGDSKTILPTIPPASIDAIVTDPPYELGFMGKAWDGSGIAYDVSLWRECLRVLKPGGHLLAFGGSRTYHRMACAVEDAGFEIRDQIMWVFGSGFPKSHNLAGEWDGWGTALKPAHEPIVVARKPLIGSVAENVATFGTGALNVGGCRVPGTPSPTRFDPARHAHDGWRMTATGAQCAANASPLGRWPANLIHDGSVEVRAAFPDASGQQAAVTGNEPTANGFSGAVKYSGMLGRVESSRPRIESDRSAARFFYCAKASRRDRNEGCDDLPDREGGMTSNTSGQHITRRDGWRPEPVKNNHPTVKPTELMRYLCRLTTPPNGTILDPFAGSGSTLKAAIQEGFRCIGIEREADYFEIARRRVEHAGRQPDLFVGGAA